MIAYAQRVGDDSKRWIYCAARAEKAGIDNVEIIEFVRFAVSVECAGFLVIAKTHGAVLVGDAGERNTLAEEQIASKKTLVTLAPVNRAFRLLLHQGPEFLDKAFVSFFIIRL